MKLIKFIILTFVFTLAAVSSKAATISIPAYFDRGAPYTDSYSLLSAVTSTGSGANTAKLAVPIAKHTCTATWGGTVPTDITLSLDGSEDGTNFNALSTVTMTASPTIFHVDKWVKYTRGTYTSKTGGGATTSLTLTCTSGGM